MKCSALRRRFKRRVDGSIEYLATEHLALELQNAEGHVTRTARVSFWPWNSWRCVSVTESRPEPGLRRFR